MTFERCRTDRVALSERTVIMTTLTEARLRALDSLHSVRDRQDPSSFEFAVADRAISLVLSENRADGPWLARDCLRNARSIEVRARARAQRGGVDFHSPVAADDDPALWVTDERPDPFERCAWQAVYARFLTSVRRLGNGADRALLGLVDGEPVKTTARAARISPRKVKSLRAEIRALSGEALVGPAS